MIEPVLIRKLNETTHEVEHAGKRRMTGGLHPTAAVATPGGAKLLATLRGSADHAECQALGRHLWSQLQLPSFPRAGEELVIESEEEHVLSLPWGNLHDGTLWLLDHDVPVRCRHPSTARGARPLAATPRLLVALPPVEAHDATFEDAQEWRRLWHEELNQGLETLGFARDARELREVLAERVDVAYLRLRPGRFDGRARPLVAYDELALADLEEALRRGPPRLLVIGCPDDRAARSATWFARLARVVPSLVVVPDSHDHHDGIDGAAARRFVDALMREGASPAQICHRMGKTRLPVHAPHCIGGWTESSPRGQPRWHMDWELQLDRKQQVSQVAYEVRQLIRENGGGLVLLWHGSSTAGLQRLHGRLLQDLRQIEHGIPREMALPWPRTAPPGESDFAGLYREKLGLAGFEAAEVSAALKRQAPELSEEGKFPILYVHHHVLDAGFHPRRLNAQVIEDYLRWWMDGIAAHRPPGLTVILALAIATSAGQDWIEGELKDTLDAFCAEPREWARVMPLNQLGNVQDRDITDFLTRFLKGRIKEPEDRVSVAREIMARTGGTYELVIRELEDIESYWPVLRDAWNERKRRGGDA